MYVYTIILADVIGIEEQLDKDKFAEILSKCVFLNIAKTLRSVKKEFSQTLKNVDLKPTQLSILVLIAYHDKLSIGQMSQELVLDTTTLTRSLDVLERDGLIERTMGKDRRKRYVILTHKGRKRTNQAVAHWQIAQNLFMQNIPSKSWNNLLSDLTNVRHVHF